MDGDVVPVPADSQVSRSPLVLTKFSSIATFFGRFENVPVRSLRAFCYLALAREVNEIALRFVLVQRRVGYNSTA